MQREASGGCAVTLDGFSCVQTSIISFVRLTLWTPRLPCTLGLPSGPAMSPCSHVHPPPRALCTSNGVDLALSPDCPKELYPKHDVTVPFSAALGGRRTSQEIDNRSRGAAIDPESLRKSAYAPRHPIDLAPQHITLTCSGTILGLPNGCRKRTWECVMCLETFPDPFPYTHPLLSTCHGARGAPNWLFPDAAPDLVISKQAKNVEFSTSPKSDLTRSRSLWVPWVTLRRG